MLHLVFKVSSTCSHTRLKSLSPPSNCFINYVLVKLVPFFSNPASLIPALKWMVSIIETYCLRDIFCQVLSSTWITSHFNRTKPQRIGLAKLSNSWKSRCQTSFHQICGHPTDPISTQWTTRSGGILQERVYKTSSKDVDELRHWIAEEWDKLDQRIIDKAVAEWRKRLQSVCGCRWRTLWTQDITFIIYDISYQNFKTQLFEILLFCSVNTTCFVEYNACYVLHF